MDVHIRQQLILQSLQQHHEVQVSALATALNCSEMTIRRDLETLESMGGLRRIHGGAVSSFLTADEAPFEIRALENVEAKSAIGAAIAHLLVDGETVILDGGSTALEAARSMRQRRLTVMPLALRPVLELDGCPGIKLLLPGGELRTNELSLIGGLTERAFDDLRFDTYVMGVCSIDVSVGVTTHLLAEATVKQAAIRAARRVIAIADASKLGKVAFAHVCNLADLDVLVTDVSADDQIVKELTAAGVDVRRV
jgi:DeoR/GlpR family transcriptional regulator of sugar metabolism